jgi:hypothetical protein
LKLRIAALYGETHAEEWKKNFERAAGKNDPFPFTKGQDDAGHIIRRVKFAFTLVGAVLFLWGVIWK